MNDRVFDADIYSVAGKLALELECLLIDTKDLSVVSKWWDSAHDALEQWRSIKDTAPTEQTEQEPVAWHEPNAYGNVTVYEKWAKENGWQPLYTAPPKREWVGLTGLEQKELMAMNSRYAVFETEAKLKEKNT